MDSLTRAPSPITACLPTLTLGPSYKTEMLDFYVYQNTLQNKKYKSNLHVLGYIQKQVEIEVKLILTTKAQG